MEIKKLEITLRPAACAVILTMALAVQAPAQTSPAPASLHLEQARSAPSPAQFTSYARELHLLSQSIPTAACLSYAGFDAERSAQTLHTAVEAFDTTLSTFERYAVQNLEEKQLVSTVRAKFQPVLVALQAMGTRPVDVFTLQVLADHNLDLQSAVRSLMNAMSQDAGSSLARLRPEAMTQDVVTRQVMLAQQMAKDTCLVIADINRHESIADLRSTISLFEVSLHALQHGMQSVGIARPPSQSLVDCLALIQFNWASIKGLVDIAISGDALSDAEASEVVAGLTTITQDIQSVDDKYRTNETPQS